MISAFRVGLRPRRESSRKVKQPDIIVPTQVQAVVNQQPACQKARQPARFSSRLQCLCIALRSAGCMHRDGHDLPVARASVEADSIAGPIHRTPKWGFVSASAAAFESDSIVSSKGVYRAMQFGHRDG